MTLTKFHCLVEVLQSQMDGLADLCLNLSSFTQSYQSHKPQNLFQGKDRKEVECNFSLPSKILR